MRVIESFPLNTITVYRNGYELQYHPDYPLIAFKGRSAPKPPPTPAPVPTPRELDEEVKRKERDKRRQRIAAAGRAGTILQQGQSLSRGSAATILGRSMS